MLIELDISFGREMIKLIMLCCLQDFHLESVHPPNVGIEDKVVHVFPVLAMLIDGLGHDDPIQDAVHVGIVRV